MGKTLKTVIRIGGKLDDEYLIGVRSEELSGIFYALVGIAYARDGGIHIEIALVIAYILIGMVKVDKGFGEVIQSATVRAIREGM